MSRTTKEVYEELAGRLDQRRTEVEALRERVRSLEADTASLHGFGAAIRWLVPSALSLFALAIVLHDRYIEPRAPSDLEELVGEAFISATGDDALPWIRTGIRIDHGNRYDIKASGRATMAIHHILDGAHGDIPPTHPWVSPSGIDRDQRIPPSTPYEKDEWRLKHLLLSEEKGGRHGMLLAYVGKDPPKARPLQIFPIGSFGEIPPENPGGELWCAVNDIWLDPKTLNALIDEPKEAQDQKDHFRVMKKIAYYKAWFDDNSGGYLIMVTRKAGEDD